MICSAQLSIEIITMVLMTILLLYIPKIYQNMQPYLSACHKSAHNGDFSYSRNFYAKDADKLYISLPVKNEQPDYELMSTLISAMQKLVIADVVKFSDEKIKATKQVVG